MSYVSVSILCIENSNLLELFSLIGCVESSHPNPSLFVSGTNLGIIYTFLFHFACAFFELVEIFFSAAMQLQYIIIHSTRECSSGVKNVFTLLSILSFYILLYCLWPTSSCMCSECVPPIQPPWFPNDKSFQIDHPTSQPCFFFFLFLFSSF